MLEQAAEGQGGRLEAGGLLGLGQALGLPAQGVALVVEVGQQALDLAGDDGRVGAFGGFAHGRHASGADGCPTTEIRSPQNPRTSPPIRTMNAETTTMKNTRTKRVPRETAVRAPM